MHMTTNNNPHNEISTLEKELFHIEHLFASANFKIGNEELGNWFQKFENYLQRNFPQYLSPLQSALNNNRTIRRTGSLSGIETFREQVGNVVSPFIIQIKESLVPSSTELHNSTIRKNVFVVHGRNKKITEAMFAFINAVELNPIEWARAVQLTGKTSPFIKEILDAAFSNAQAVVVLFTPDDYGYLKEEFRSTSDPLHDINPTGQARLNVIFEAGMAMASHPDRTILVECGNLRPFSDISGIHLVRMNNSPERRFDLVDRLKQAQCELNTEGKRRWLEIGDFQP